MKITEIKLINKSGRNAPDKRARGNKHNSVLLKPIKKFSLINFNLINKKLI